jgi:predicted Zn finger-like uncharacterized protein
MIISCPNCAARYQLEASRLGAGRRVRCSRCQHEWFQPPPEGAPAEMIDDSKAPDPRDARALPPPASDAASAPAAAMRAEPRAMRAERAVPPRARPAPPPKTRPAWLGWAGLVLFLAILVGTMFAAREAGIAFWPASQRAYGALGLGVPKPGDGLIILDVKTAASEDGSTPVLLVTGIIRNTAAHSREVPLLKAELRDTKGEALRKWLFEPAKRTLGPKEDLPFETRTESPPGGATGLAITFEAAP